MQRPILSDFLVDVFRNLFEHDFEVILPCIPCFSLAECFSLFALDPRVLLSDCVFTLESVSRCQSWLLISALTIFENWGIVESGGVSHGRRNRKTAGAAGG